MLLKLKCYLFIFPFTKDRLFMFLYLVLFCKYFMENCTRNNQKCKSIREWIYLMLCVYIYSIYHDLFSQPWCLRVMSDNMESCFLICLSFYQLTVLGCFFWIDRDITCDSVEVIFASWKLVCTLKLKNVQVLAFLLWVWCKLTLITTERLCWSSTNQTPGLCKAWWSLSLWRKDYLQWNQSLNKGAAGKGWYCSCLSRSKYVNREWPTFDRVNIVSAKMLQHTHEKCLQSWHFISTFISLLAETHPDEMCPRLQHKRRYEKVKCFYKTLTQKHAH